MKQLICLKIAILFCYTLVYSQMGLEFHPSKAFYLKGNAFLTGNNIVGINPQIAYNDPNEINDNINVVYIDIDQDSTTFSSSSADLVIDKYNEIAYAALYWSATYPFESGEKNKKGRDIIYQGHGERQHDFNNVLLKLPASNQYVPITGNIVFDSYQNQTFESNSPYVCYADVTQLLKDSEELNGTYTVANIKASRGYILSGSCGGWLLYVIYKSNDLNPKYFSIYNGFVSVESKPVIINFKHFKTPQESNTNASLSIATLEGDRRINSDICTIMNSDNQTFTKLNTSDRGENNFFNSRISVNHTLRNPNSTNTLGFDILKVDLPNENHSILKPNSSEMAIQFSTKVDRYYPFFIAFETDISSEFFESKQEHLMASTENTIHSTFESISSSTAGEIIQNSTDLSESTKLEIDKKINALTAVSVPTLAKGYYLVTNVFRNKTHTTNWMTFLNEKGYNPHYYINPENNWYYVYIKRDTDPYYIFLEKDKLSEKEYFKGLWVAKINY